MIDLIPTAEQESIADGIATFLADKLPVERHRTDKGRRGRSDRELWAELAELGCFGLSLEERHGGLGLTLAEEALAFREFGRYLVSPAAIGAVVGARVAAGAGLADLVDEILSGRRLVGLANPLAPTTDASGRGLFHLIEVAPGDLVLGWSEGRAALYEAESFESIEPRASLDPSVRLSRASLGARKPLASAQGGDLPLVATLASAAMLVGVLEAVRDMAVAYAQTRVQFGVPIGTFQAVKHKCADIAMWTEAAWSQTAYAAVVMQELPGEAAFQAVTAKLIASEAALNASRDNIQIHGGMGFTAELNAHLFLKRTHLLAQLGGSPAELRRKLLELDPGNS
jgi:alkylation response protein AidB-like acyl-CoA dehydrogenase